MTHAQQSSRKRAERSVRSYLVLISAFCVLLAVFAQLNYSVLLELNTGRLQRCVRFGYSTLLTVDTDSRFWELASRELDLAEPSETNWKEVSTISLLRGRRSTPAYSSIVNNVKLVTWVYENEEVRGALRKRVLRDVMQLLAGGRDVELEAYVDRELGGWEASGRFPARR